VSVRYSARMRLLRSHVRPAAAVFALAAALCLLAAAAPALRAAAQAAPAPVVVRSVALSPAQARSARIHTATIELPIRANLLGGSWRGRADHLELRARGDDGRWSRWVPLESAGDGPDPGSREGRAQRGRTVAGAPIWVGNAQQVQVRSERPARDIRIEALNVEGTATRRSRIARAVRSSAARVLGVSSAAATVSGPRMSRRSAWRARQPRYTPELADEALGVVVHHTASTNRYSCAQVPALLRGIQRYHMDSNGWNDIGYNYLIDRCGRVWEGRSGGLAKPVIGAHTSGFNTSTVGVSLLGSFSSTRPTPQARRALQRFVAWRMDIAHRSSNGRMALTARTSDKFALGSRVVARSVSGHRDLYPSACPGALAYRDLNAIARGAWAEGGIKVANLTRTFTLADEAAGTLGSVSVRAVSNQSSSRMTMRLERRSSGEVLRDVSVTGRAISTRWYPPAGSTVPVWDVVVRVDAVAASGQRARPLLEPLGAWGDDPGFTVTTPPAPSVHPGGDPANDELRVGYTLARDARLGAWFYDPATSQWLVTALPSEWRPATAGGVGELVVPVPEELADGTYELRVGNEDDRAPGRSMRRYSATVAREA
jgi:hypothetical protein